MNVYILYIDRHESVYTVELGKVDLSRGTAKWFDFDEHRQTRTFVSYALLWRCSVKVELL